MSAFAVLRVRVATEAKVEPLKGKILPYADARAAGIAEG